MQLPGPGMLIGASLGIPPSDPGTAPVSRMSPSPSPPWDTPSKPQVCCAQEGSHGEAQGTGRPPCTGRSCCAQLTRSSSAAQQHCNTFTCGHRGPGAEGPCATKAVLPAWSVPAGCLHPAPLQLLRGPAQLGAIGVLMKFMSQSERKKLFSADFTHHFLPWSAAHLLGPDTPLSPRPERSAPALSLLTHSLEHSQVVLCG